MREATQLLHSVASSEKAQLEEFRISRDEDPLIILDLARFRTILDSANFASVQTPDAVVKELVATLVCQLKMKVVRINYCLPATFGKL